MKPAGFQYHRAHSVEQALTLLAELGEDAKLIAGGQSLVAMMNFRLARPAHLIDIGPVHELRYVRREGNALTIGALTTHRQVEIGHAAELADGFEVIANTMAWIGHLPIRTRGTVGGSLAHADATAEWCVLAILLDAEIIVASVRGRRSIAAAEFFFGFYSTALEPDEMVLEIRFPRPARHTAVTEYAQRQGDFAVAGVAVDLDMTDGAIRGGRIVVSGIGPVPARCTAGEAVLADAGPVTEDLARRCAEAIAASSEPDNTSTGGPDYLRGVVRTLAAQAIAEAATTAEVMS